MRCSNCGVCCTETEMLLSEKDIDRLVKHGINRNFFVETDAEGYTQLRNREGYCVFYNVKKRRCSVYRYRPLGCRVYPVILDEEKGIILDDICESINTIPDSEKAAKGNQVIRLLERIDSEAENRRF